MVRINFKHDIDNASLQIGDMAYYVKDDDTSTSVTTFTDDIKPIGLVFEIGNTHIVCNSTTHPPADAFIMFQKDREVNNASLLGYYAEIELRNNSDKKAELFALSSEIAQSSK